MFAKNNLSQSILGVKNAMQVTGKNHFSRAQTLIKEY